MDTNSKKTAVKKEGKKKLPSYVTFKHGSYSWKQGIDYRSQPELYKIGKGEQGVLTCEPYKSEILPHWRFKTPEIATESSALIYAQFLEYLDKNDFIGADMARKYLQMGFTRARRYTNYKGGRKYTPETYDLLPRGTGDPQKAISADIFFKKWKEAEQEPRYILLKEAWKKKYG